MDTRLERHIREQVALRTYTGWRKLLHLRAQEFYKRHPRFYLPCAQRHKSQDGEYLKQRCEPDAIYPRHRVLPAFESCQSSCSMESGYPLVYSWTFLCLLELILPFREFRVFNVLRRSRLRPKGTRTHER